MTTALTDTLGREKTGTVVATEWYGVSAVVKAFARNETNFLEVPSHERYLFKSEVEAYEIAGGADLWGVADPKPLLQQWLTTPAPCVRLLVIPCPCIRKNGATLNCARR